MARVPTGSPNNPASLAKSASPTGTRTKATSVDTKAGIEVFTDLALGCGLSGSADLASEASDEADRSGPNPARNNPRTQKSNHNRLRLQPNPKALVHAGLNGFGQRHDLAARAGVLAPTPIDQHQRLLFINTSVTDGLAFPAAGVDQPACGQFDAAVGHGVVHHLWLAGDDVGALIRRHRGVLEEAAGVARPDWRQF